jgi:phosphoribosylaminoimidazolecarboxamide formyltransferase/IMP cyclohydrolase
MVICNLYPFETIINASNCSLTDAIENIDIGGVTLLRAAAKNCDRVTVVCDPNDYKRVIDELKANNGDTTQQFRRQLALKVCDYLIEF